MGLRKGGLYMRSRWAKLRLEIPTWRSSWQGQSAHARREFFGVTPLAPLVDSLNCQRKVSVGCANARYGANRRIAGKRVTARIAVALVSADRQANYSAPGLRF